MRNQIRNFGIAALIAGSTTACERVTTNEPGNYFAKFATSTPVTLPSGIVYRATAEDHTADGYRLYVNATSPSTHEETRCAFTKSLKFLPEWMHSMSLDSVTRGHGAQRASYYKASVGGAGTSEEKALYQDALDRNGQICREAMTEFVAERTKPF